MSERDSAMAGLEQRFIARCADDLPFLEANLAGTIKDENGVQLVAHKMAGSAGLFGHAALGELATQLDDELAAKSLGPSTTLSQLVAALRTLLGR